MFGNAKDSGTCWLANITECHKAIAVDAVALSLVDKDGSCRGVNSNSEKQEEMKDEPLNTFQQNARHVGKCAKLAADLASALQERDELKAKEDHRKSLDHPFVCPWCKEVMPYGGDHERYSCVNENCEKSGVSFMQMSIGEMHDLSLIKSERDRMREALEEALNEYRYSLANFCNILRMSDEEKERSIEENSTVKKLTAILSKADEQLTNTALKGE